MMKTLIIIPAYNEEENIRRTIDSLDDIQADILVVNDCSTDQTVKLAQETGKVEIVDLSCNLGIGGAVQTGFIYARENEYDCAVQFDGDGQHIAGEIPKLISFIERGQADVVIGSRFCEKHEGFRSTASRRLGIRFFQWINHLITGQKITDCTSGFRAYNRLAITLLAKNYPSDFPEPEAVTILGRNGFRIREVYVEMQERQGGISSIGGLKSVYYMIKVSLSILLTWLRPKNDFAENENKIIAP
jgi:glycosyltransferase involved in cell wall biosynthesis